jgi:hypothetical protein
VRRRPSAISIALAWTAFVAAGSARAEPATTSPVASPPNKEACVAAFDRGQRAQSDRALRRAQSELIVCSQESCPTVLRADCAGVLAEVRSALPSVVFAADDGNGHELTDVKVYAGSELLTSQLDGRAIPIDPGTFELRFEHVGQPAVVVSRMGREGEKSRVIRISMVAPGAADGAQAGTSPGADVTSRKRATVGWVLPGSLAAVGLAALSIALYTRLQFDSRVDELRGSCAPECSQRQRDDLSGMVVTSNVALGVGIGALAFSVATWFLTAPPSSSGSAGPARAAASVVSPRGLAW